MIIGFSNITQSALKSNIEWNVEIISKEDANFIIDVLREYDNLWNMSVEADEDFITRYENFLKTIKNTQSPQRLICENSTT